MASQISRFLSGAAAVIDRLLILFRYAGLDITRLWVGLHMVSFISTSRSTISQELCVYVNGMVFIMRANELIFNDTSNIFDFFIGKYNSILLI